MTIIRVKGWRPIKRKKKINSKQDSKYVQMAKQASRKFIRQHKHLCAEMSGIPNLAPCKRFEHCLRNHKLIHKEVRGCYQPEYK